MLPAPAIEMSADSGEPTPPGASGTDAAGDESEGARASSDAAEEGQPGEPDAGAPEDSRPETAAAWSVTVDPSFGAFGIVQGEASTWLPAGAGLTADGRILVSGPSTTPGVAELIRRFQPDGSADLSFGSGGARSVAVVPEALPQSVATLPDGRAVVFGATAPGTIAGAFAVRLDGFGGIDANFAVAGVLETTAAGEGYAGLWSADGSGYALGGSAVVRIAADGSVDPTFGAAAFQIRARAGVVASDGRLFVASGGQLWCFSSGVPDPTFGVNGSVDLTPPGANNFRIDAVVLGAAQKIVVIGAHIVSPNRFADVALVTPSGTADPAFVAGGLGAMTIAGTAIGGAELPDGRILFWTDVGELAAVLPGGARDDSLGGSGVVDLGILGAAYAGVLDAQERLVLVGTASNMRFPQWFVRRYTLF